jgi:arylsulfatase A-like enzyme
MPDSMNASVRRGLGTLWIAATLAATTACGPSDEPRANLLLVTVDSLRPDFLGCYGGDPAVGVSMCALADHGVRYTWALSPSPSSAPAIASLLTSTHPSGHGVTSSAATFLRGDIERLPELLRRNGFTTAAFVGSPELNRSRNLQQGFDLYDDWSGASDPRGAPERRAEELTEAVLAWIGSTAEPWFVWVHYRDPHGPYDAPVDTASALAPTAGADDTPRRARTTGPGQRLRVLPTPNGRGGIPGYQALPGLFTREAYERRYEAEIRYVDGQLARLFAQVATGEAPTGIALTADHGEAFGEDRYFFTHGHSVALDQIRVPLFWRPPRSGAPGTPVPPERVDVPVSILDVAPTLLRAAGVATPDAFHGRPLQTETDTASAPQVARAIFAESETRVAAIVGRTYYARDRDPTVPIESAKPSARALRLAGARTARLEAGPTPDAAPPLPAYQAARPAGAAEVLEPRLAAFLAPVAPEPPPEESDPALPGLIEELEVPGTAPKAPGADATLD